MALPAIRARSGVACRPASEVEHGPLPPLQELLEHGQEDALLHRRHLGDLGRSAEDVRPRRAPRAAGPARPNTPRPRPCLAPGPAWPPSGSGARDHGGRRRVRAAPQEDAAVPPAQRGDAPADRLREPRQREAGTGRSERYPARPRLQAAVVAGVIDPDAGLGYRRECPRVEPRRELARRHPQEVVAGVERAAIGPGCGAAEPAAPGDQRGGGVEQPTRVADVPRGWRPARARTAQRAGQGAAASSRSTTTSTTWACFASRWVTSRPRARSGAITFSSIWGCSIVRYASVEEPMSSTLSPGRSSSLELRPHPPRGFDVHLGEP